MCNCWESSVAEIDWICWLQGRVGWKLNCVKLSLDTRDLMEIQGMGSLPSVKQGRSFCQTT